MPNIVRSITLILLLLTPLATLSAADWPAWRGINSDGVSPDTGLPSSWSPEGENLLWKAEVGARSTPIVLDGRVCVIRLAEPQDETKWQEQIVCLDEKTGKQVWEYRYNVFQTDIPHHRIGWASLVGDAETGIVYSHSVEGMVHSFDKTGKVLWSRSLAEQLGTIYGFGGRTVTPILDGDLFIVSFLTAGWGPNFIPRHRFYAIDKNTGETVWISTPGAAPYDTTYCAPIVRVINGERLLISGNGDGGVYALRVGTGEKVWGFPLSKRGINPSIVVEGNLVFASHSEENVDGSTAMGRMVALDASQVVDGKPKLAWMVDGFAAGYASPAVHDGVVYQVDNSANVVAFDTKTGEELWKLNIGIAQKASPVIGDGKLYVSDVDGKFHIVKLGDEPELLDVEEFHNEDGSATQINGSPAIANGRVFLLTNNTLYCIGTDEGKSHAAAPMLATPEKAPAGAAPAHVQVVPAEVNLTAGAQQNFRARTFDAKGRLIGDAAAQWSSANIEGEISADGSFTVGAANVPQGGTVTAAVGEIKGQSLVAVRIEAPFQYDFSDVAADAVPDGWPAARGRFKAVEKDGEKVFMKPSGNPRSWRTTVYYGDPDARDYDVQVDVLPTEIKRRMPDVGLVSHRYTMALMGNAQKLMVRTWMSEFGRFSKEVRFRWDPDVWYRIKFRVVASKDNGPAKLYGKVWKRDEPEPDAWTIEAEDAIGHSHGSPGLYGYASADIYYDNLSVTPRGQ